MPVFTLTTDFGNKDHYVAAVKAHILRQVPNAAIVDVSHSIKPNNIIEGAFVLKNVYKEFPDGTVHIIGVDENNASEIIIVSLDGQFFITRNNGFISLLNNSNSKQTVKVLENKKTAFTTKNIFADLAVALAKGKHISDLGSALNQINEARLPEPYTSANEIKGSCVYIDNYGNLISNISKDEFQKIQKGRDFEIRFEREKYDKINDTYTDVEEGEIVCIFNNNNMLEVAVRNGSAHKLFGLNVDSVINITFK